MPNIEIHGCNPTNAIVLQNSIHAAMKKDYSAPDEVVTTIYPTEVRTSAGRKSPFLRIVAMPDDWDELTKILYELGEDMEVVPLGKWIPKGD